MGNLCCGDRTKYEKFRTSDGQMPKKERILEICSFDPVQRRCLLDEGPRAKDNNWVDLDAGGQIIATSPNNTRLMGRKILQIGDKERESVTDFTGFMQKGDFKSVRMTMSGWYRDESRHTWIQIRKVDGRELIRQLQRWYNRGDTTQLIVDNSYRNFTKNITFINTKARYYDTNTITVHDISILIQLW